MQEMYLIVYEDGRVYEHASIDFSTLKKNEKENVHFLFKAESKKAYSDIELYDENDGFIDSCFISYKWENVNVETYTYLDNGKRFAVLKLQKEIGEAYHLKNVEFSTVMDNLFDGGVLYQIAPQKAQIMGYIYVAKCGEVIAIDGGMAGDKDEVKRIIQKHGGVVHHWFITHYHNDHIGAIIELFKENSVKVDNLYFDFPHPDFLKDRGDGDNYLVEVWNALLPKETKVITPKKGDVYPLKEVSITVLNDAAFDILHDLCYNLFIIW